MGDAFAVRRLRIPPRVSRARPHQGVLEIPWSAFGEMTRELAERIAERYRPEVVLGVAKGGVFVGGAVASALGIEFFPLGAGNPARDGKARPAPRQRLPDLRGKRVLVVTGVSNSGRTLETARALARRARAREVQRAALVVRPGGARPEWFAVEAREVVVFAWDYHLDGSAAAGADPGETGV